MSLSGGAIAGIVVASLVVLILAFVFVLRRYLRGPTKGSDNIKRLDGKIVVITGKPQLDRLLHRYLK